MLVGDGRTYYVCSEEALLAKNTTVLMVRHGEKPADGPDLTVAGQARAQAYVAYFQNYVFHSQRLTIDYLFAAADSPASHRSRLTLTPLAAALGLKINDQHVNHDYQQLAADMLQNPIYDDRTILVCWHHGELLALAAALGIDPDKLPAAARWPGLDWPDDVFGWLLQVHFDEHGVLSPTATFCINEQLMYGDHGKDPPHGH